MATYKEIQNYIKEKYKFTVKTCWIADIKNKFGLITRKAPNRKGLQRLHPCPQSKESYIVEALRYFKMIR
jgi:hypothetical protein